MLDKTLAHMLHYIQIGQEPTKIITTKYLGLGIAS